MQSIPSRCVLHILTLCVLHCSLLQQPEGKPKTRSSRWVKGQRAFNIVKGVLKKCPTLKVVQEFAGRRSLYSESEKLKVQKLDKTLLLFYRWTDPSAISIDYRWLVAPSACTAFGLVDDSIGNGRLLFKAHGRSIPAEKEQHSYAKAWGMAIARPNLPGFAAARLYLDTCKCNEPGSTKKGWALCGPLFPAQPTFRGKPLGSPQSLWMNKAIRSTAGQPKDIRGRPLALKLTERVSQPRLHRRFGRHLIYRSRGGDLALYDAKKGTHRWVLGWCQATGGTIRWFGRRQGLLVGSSPMVSSIEGVEESTNLFVVDLDSGAVYVFLFSSYSKRVAARFNGSTLAVTGLQKSAIKIPLQEIKDRIKRGLVVKN